MSASPVHADPPRIEHEAEPRRVPVISVFTSAFNEAETIRHCVEEVKRVCAALAPKYDYEHVVADNCSSDSTLAILRELARSNPRLRVITYSRNFGAEKSGMTLLRHTSGDAMIGVPADLQEPIDVLPGFIERWEQGYEVVYGVYENREEGWLRRKARDVFYRIVHRVSEDPLPRNFSGFALMDRIVVDEVVKNDDHAPYTRGIIATVGFRQIGVPYERRARESGASKHGWSFLFGFGANGIIAHTTLPIRLASMVGVFLSVTAVLMSIAYVIMKLVNWNFQAPGATTTVVLVLFFSGVQLFFLGVIGEYIAAIHTQVRHKPYVIVRERINFDDGPASGRAPTRESNRTRDERG